MLIDLRTEKNECVSWLTDELNKVDLTHDIDVKTLEQCRGQEFYSLVTITYECVGNTGNEEFNQTAVLESWTRAAASLYVIHMAEKGPLLINALLQALEKKLAKPANEQDEIGK